MASLWDLFGQQDPLDPYIGAYGPRSLTGPGRGSPGGLPFQAREVNPLVLTRERLARELEDKPFLQPRFDANTTAEVGTDPEKRRWYQALTMDRAAQTGQPLENIVNASNYYPGSTTLKTATTGQGVDPSLWEGANPANYATGNSSFDPKTGRWVGFAGGPQTSTYGSGRGMELGGIEGQGGLPYARAVGYTGPSTTPIGPAGPQGVGSAPPLEGGDAYASASGPAKGRTMPDSLMDMFQPRSSTGEPIGFGDALAQNRQSLIGLGMGLLQPRSLAVGAPATSAWGNALAGYQQGASADAANIYRQAQLQHLKTQEARQAAQDAFTRQMAEKQFTRGGETEFQKMQADIQKYKGTPQEAAVTQFYQSKTEPPTVAWQEDASGNKVPYVVNPRSTTAPVVPAPGFTTQTAQNPYASSGKMTTDEGKTALYADRAATAHDTITKYENLNQQPGGMVGGLIQQNLPAGAANVLVSGERGRAMDAQRAFVNALLRRESGAAINAGEFVSYAKEYFPQLGDTPDQIEAKRQHRAEVIAGLARESGKGYRPTYSFNEKGYITRGAPSYAGQGGGTAAAPAAAGTAPAAPAPVSAPAAAIRALKNNPKLRDEFDAKYGEGTAMRILTGK